jgi:hypothetical protein
MFYWFMTFILVVFLMKVMCSMGCLHDLGFCCRLNVRSSHYCNHLEGKKIKSGLRITRTGQFTVIHDQKRRRRNTNDKDSERDRIGEKKDVQRPQ